MPADPLYPGEVDPEPRPEGQFRAELVRYLNALPTSELGSLLSGLPRTQPGVLMVELNQRLPDSAKLLPPAGTPGPNKGRRRSLREWAADRRAARNQQSMVGRPMWSIDTAGARASPRRERWTPPPGGGCKTRCARSVRRPKPTRPNWNSARWPTTIRAAHPTCSGQTSRTRPSGTTTTMPV
jgi:hypothetical protein